MKITHLLKLLAAALPLSPLLLTGPASASLAHPAPVSENPADTTPHLVSDATVSRPRVDALVRSDGTMFAGGLFHAVTGPTQTATVQRTNLMAFNETTGEISAAFAPQFNGAVNALEATSNALYVGGAFTTVDGHNRRALVKLDPDTGAVDTTFNANFTGGSINDIQLIGSRLFVAGSARTKLMALDPNTGLDTGYLNLNIKGRVEGSSGGTSVFRFAVNPQRTKLAAVGNFLTVGGQLRHRAFLADLGASNTTLNGWYYNSLTKPCASTSAVRQAYLSDVDFSPDGSYFVVGSTGFIPRFESEIGETICDAVARFDVAVANPNRPAWINYTGGDTIWSVAATGAAVYVQGHFRWLNNPYGHDNAGPGAVRRKGVGAVDPTNGQALPWNPSAPAKWGGKVLYATHQGMWFGSDGTHFNGEYHHGIAFTPQ